MLAKLRRLKSATLFKKALAGRRLFVCDAFVMYGVGHRRIEPLAPARFGLIISKKTEKRAARRNRLKRRMREILRRQIIPECEAMLADYAAIVLIMRPPALEKSFDALSQLTRHAFRDRRSS